MSIEYQAGFDAAKKVNEIQVRRLKNELDNLKAKIMNNAVDHEQEVLRLKDELALERAKAVSRHDFIASFFTGES